MTPLQEAPWRDGMVDSKVAHGGDPPVAAHQVLQQTTIGRVALTRRPVAVSVPVDDVAQSAGTIGYELLCAVALRVPLTVA